MPLLDIKHLSVTRPGRQQIQHLLLDNINCSVEAGEILSIIGPNGAGKSTLIKALAGDISYSGDISINGLARSATERARQLAILPQLSLLNFPYRVSEVVNLARIPHCTGRQRDDEIIDQALALMDIRFLKHRLYPELSGGEKQRVQIARALAQIWDEQDAANGTRILLLDEPTNSLDFGHQHELMSVIRSLAEQKVAVVMVLHDINLAAQYSDSILALLCSQQVAHGGVEHVITSHNMQRLFGINAEVITHPNTDKPVLLGKMQ